MKVVNEYVLVKVANDEEVTESGIILSAAKQERKYEGVVVDTGDNPDIKKFGVETGDYVFYPKGLNKEIIIDNVTYDVVSIYDILAVGTEE
jgi:co-chaperonin GroES (HSP10)